MCRRLTSLPSTACKREKFLTLSFGGARATAITSALFCTMQVCYAGTLTPPTTKFPYCLTARTNTLDCDRKSISSPWRCAPRAGQPALGPQCFKWDLAKIPGKCVQWTDGAKIYSKAPHSISDAEVVYRNSILRKHKISNEPSFVCMDAHFLDFLWPSRLF